MYIWFCIQLSQVYTQSLYSNRQTISHIIMRTLIYMLQINNAWKWKRKKGAIALYMLFFWQQFLIRYSTFLQSAVIDQCKKYQIFKCAGNQVYGISQRLWSFDRSRQEKLKHSRLIKSAMSLTRIWFCILPPCYTFIVHHRDVVHMPQLLMLVMPFKLFYSFFKGEILIEYF